MRKRAKNAVLKLRNWSQTLRTIPFLTLSSLLLAACAAAPEPSDGATATDNAVYVDDISYWRDGRTNTCFAYAADNRWMGVVNCDAVLTLVYDLPAKEHE